MNHDTRLNIVFENSVEYIKTSSNMQYIVCITFDYIKMSFCIIAVNVLELLISKVPFKGMVASFKEYEKDKINSTLIYFKDIKTHELLNLKEFSCKCRFKMKIFLKKSLNREKSRSLKFYD